MNKTVTFVVLISLLITGCNSLSSSAKPNDNYNNISQEELTNMIQGNNTSNTNDSKVNKYNAAPAILPKEELTKKKSILQTEKGDIEIELFGEEAPLAVSNHIFLVNEGFYDNLIFHRREENFVIQGGDPMGSGYGGPGYRFEDEPVAREYDRGIVAMANSGPDTNGSQFFIMLDDKPLPPAYTIFGKVIKGLEVVDKIQVGDKINKALITDLE